MVSAVRILYFFKFGMSKMLQLFEKITEMEYDTVVWKNYWNGICDSLNDVFDNYLVK